MIPHIDLQQVAALGIVAVAAFAVGKRFWNQITAFRKPTSSSGCGGCSGCGTASKATQTPAPLVQIQLTAPPRLKRPSSE